jgi:hypothetical protein
MINEHFAEIVFFVKTLSSLHIFAKTERSILVSSLLWSTRKICFICLSVGQLNLFLGSGPGLVVTLSELHDDGLTSSDCGN